MPSNSYHFITHWRVEGDLDEVREVIGDSAGLPRWWPSVYLDVQVREPGDANGVGRVVGLYTKGWLPYTLRWDFRVTDVQQTRLALEAWGDFDGTGVWTFKQDGAFVDITYDWKINAEKALLRYLSFVMKPLFSANHQWAMRMGEESLRLELARRRAKTADERARIAPPPPPTPQSPLRMLWNAIHPPTSRVSN